MCSVSECVAPAPDDWIQSWLHNEWGFFDTPQVAWSLVPSGERGTYDVYGYELYDVRFVKGEESPLTVEAPGVAPLDSSFELLGHDVVSRGTSDFFECSPLSCNLWAKEVSVNAHCLVEDPTEALRLAAVAEASRCEPGDYHVVRVWRSRHPAPDPEGRSAG